MYKISVEKLIFRMKAPIRFRQEYFPAATDIIVWSMQNFSSIHRPRKKFERDQGLDHAVGAHAKFMKFAEHRRVRQALVAQTRKIALLTQN